MRKANLIIPAIVVVALIGLSSIFIVDEREKALVLQFGRVVSVKEDPGLAFKIPLIQEVVRYDDRILSRDVDPLEVTPLDDRRLVVDAFARYRISDVTRFRQAVGSGGIGAAETRLDSILRAELREVLGSVTSNDILSSDRAALMLRIRNAAIAEAQGLGLEIIDVRLKSTDLPQQNLAATFDRMRAERQREATDERARGNEAAQRVRAQADRTVVELVSESQREAEIIRGEADADRNQIFAEAFGRDEEFFEFYRSLTAYTRALKGGNSSMVITPNSEFFNYLKSPSGLGQSADRSPASLPSAANIDSPPQDPAPEAQEDAAADTDASDSTQTETTNTTTSDAATTAEDDAAAVADTATDGSAGDGATEDDAQPVTE